MSMRQGDCFLSKDRDVEEHFHFILSDPTRFPDQVILLSLTTASCSEDKTCLLNTGDHDWITRQSAVAFGFAKVTTLAALVEARDDGLLRFQQPFEDDVLQHILKAVKKATRFLPRKMVAVFTAQGFLP